MSFSITKIQATDDADICTIIKQVGAEFGASGEGFGPADSEVLNMSQHYTDATNSVYFVATIDGVIVGGCGLGSFNQSSTVCELRKLFLLAEARGMGIGKQLVIKCLDYAKQHHYTQCYLDTLKTMTTAIALYKKLGFRHLESALQGATHNGCNVWMLKTL